MSTATPAGRPRRGTAPPAVLAALALLAGLGLAAALVALAAMTLARPTATVTATATARAGAPLVVTAPGVLESRPGPVTVRARGAGRVVLAVGRQGDVAAWADGAARTTLTRLASPTRLATRSEAGATTAPDPVGSDLWVQQATGTGAASLTYRALPGSWLLLAAGDGSGPAPSSLSLGWREQRAPAWALPVLVAGVVALLAGALGLLRLGGGPSALAGLAGRVPVPARRPRSGS